MMGPTHYLLGAYAGTAVGLASGWPLWQTVTSGMIATATAHGHLSPDADQSWLRWVGRHRGITHWWMWPLLIAGFGLDVGPAGWPLLAVAAGIASHIVGDFFYGSPGVPLLPMKPWMFVGLRLRMAPKRGQRRWSFGGRSEPVVRWLLRWGLVPLAAFTVWQSLG